MTSEANLVRTEFGFLFILYYARTLPSDRDPSWTRSSGDKGNGEESTLVVSSNSSN